MKIFSNFHFVSRSLLFILPETGPFRSMSTLRKVFVRSLDSENTIKINFSYGATDFPERVFTFIRSKEEKLENCLARIQLKILDAMTKKLSKKNKRLPTEKDATLPTLRISLSREQTLIDNSSKCIDAWTSSSELKVNEHVYQIVHNPPTVLSISLPKNIMRGFPVYPKISLEFCSKDECQFIWYRLISKSNILSSLQKDIIKIKGESWLPLAEGFFYVATANDVGCKLKVTCLPKSQDKMGLEENAVSSSFVQLGPERCPFEDRQEYTKELTNSGSLRCVSYNILADLYADSDTARNELFPYCPAEALMFDYRKQLYLKEIIGYNGDIICLQEVDRKVFFDDLIPVLASKGLKGIYSEKGGQVVEGLSCFYRDSKFELIESHAIILNEALKSESALMKIYSNVTANEKLLERLMNRTTALQIVLLQSKEFPHRRLLIGNTHLYFHPESDNIRLIQAACCITYLEKLLLKHKSENTMGSIGLLFCGDFNSCPEFGVYELMTRGSLNEKCPDWNSNPEEIIPGFPLMHSLLLESACGTPSYTNYTEGFVGCLDYIFFDCTSLKVRDVVPFPKHEQIIENRAIPSIVFPSDHIALACTLDWK